VAKTFDALTAWARAVGAELRERTEIVHARTFVAGVMGLVLAPLLRAKLVYHNEGFYPDEQVDGGVWMKGSAIHRLACLIERLLYSRADGIVVLSERAKVQVERLPAVRRRVTPVIVVPSCVDLEEFPVFERQRWCPGRTLRLVYVGSVGNRYMFDRVAEFAAAAYGRLGKVTLRVLTRTPRNTIEDIVRRSGLPSELMSVECVPHARMAEELAQRDAGLFLFTQGLSEHGCSPTKVGEYWASGLPVVITPNVSDTEDVIRRERVGVILQDFSAEAYDRALDELLALLDDPDLARRCRAAAERHYALEPACERLHSLYQALIGSAPQVPGGGGGAAAGSGWHAAETGTVR
jgi:glycosyltransferase involved in cell wall biosynthesis